MARAILYIYVLYWLSCGWRAGQPTGPGGIMMMPQQQQPLFPAAAAAQGNSYTAIKTQHKNMKLKNLIFILKKTARKQFLLYFMNIIMAPGLSEVKAREKGRGEQKR